MARGSVTVIDENRNQTTPAGVERTALFVGRGLAGHASLETLVTLDSQSKLDDLLGAGDRELKTQLQAAQQNGGQNWFAYAYVADPSTGIANMGDIASALDEAKPELLVWLIPQAMAAAGDLSDQLDDMAALIAGQLAAYGRRIIMLAAVRGIEPGTETWSAYQTLLTTEINGLINHRVAFVPQLHGNDIGVLAGRLCRHEVSIADSPMRVATGALLGLGDTPTDLDGNPLSEATLAALDTAGYSVPQRYPDYPGVYWGDCNLLESPTGDFQVIEYLRPLDKAARAVRLMAIAKIANREFNSTPGSIAAHKTYFARPLREMSQSRRAFGVTLPGDILPPDDDAIVIQWISKTEVEIYVTAQPYNSPKKITAKMALDLSTL